MNWAFVLHSRFAEYILICQLNMYDMSIGQLKHHTLAINMDKHHTGSYTVKHVAVFHSICNSSVHMISIEASLQITLCYTLLLWTKTISFTHFPQPTWFVSCMFCLFLKSFSFFLQYFCVRNIFSPFEFYAPHFSAIKTELIEHEDTFMRPH